MRSRVALPGLVLLFSAASIAVAGGASADPVQPQACFGAFSSTFAQANPASELLVSGVARSAPGALGQVASTKPTVPTGCD